MTRKGFSDPPKVCLNKFNKYVVARVSKFEGVSIKRQILFFNTSYSYEKHRKYETSVRQTTHEKHLVVAYVPERITANQCRHTYSTNDTLETY